MSTDHQASKSETYIKWDRLQPVWVLAPIFDDALDQEAKQKFFSPEVKFTQCRLRQEKNRKILIIGKWNWIQCFKLNTTFHLSETKKFTDWWDPKMSKMWQRYTHDCKGKLNSHIFSFFRSLAVYFAEQMPGPVRLFNEFFLNALIYFFQNFEQIFF